MRPKINCITLTVDDLQRSFNFYRNGLSLTEDELEADADHYAFELSKGLYLAILPRKDFSEFRKKANLSPSPEGVSECVLSYFTSTKEEVDEILKGIEKAGGLLAGVPKEEAWGYAGYFKDPDSHLWEIMFNPKMV